MPGPNLIPELSPDGRYVLHSIGDAANNRSIVRVADLETGVNVFETDVPVRDLRTYIVVGRQMARVLTEYSVPGVASAEAIESPGSDENIDRLLARTAHLGLVFAPSLAGHAQREELGVLLVLYQDVWQVVVNKSAGIGGLEDLRSKRIFIGPEESSTRWGARRILAGVAISDSDYSLIDVDSYAEASRLLQNGEADAAFFLSAIPSVAVKAVMGSGCCEILDLGGYLKSIDAHLPSMTSRTVTAYSYENQPAAVRTLGASVLLVARKDLDGRIVSAILDSAFDHLSEFEVANIRVQDVRLDQAFDLPAGFELHAGAAMFVDRERDKLWIATGVINGKYYELGRRIQQILRRWRIASRVIHTDGAIENLILTETHPKTIAITQYDTALASIWTTAVYGPPELVRLDFKTVDGLKRIAVLHEEKLHVLIRRDRVGEVLPDRPTVRLLEDARVCLGAPNSGTQVLAKILLRAHDVVPRETLHLSVPDMVARINSGEIDAGFFVSHVPSEVLKTVANDDRNLLLSIDPREVAGLLSRALSSTQFPPETYGAQRPGEPPVDTLSTRAVLVAKEDLPIDLVERITEALFDAQDFLGIPGGQATMAQQLASLELHPGALAYYQRAGLRPRLPRPTWAEVLLMAGQALAIVMVVAAASPAILSRRRKGISNKLGRRILGIPIDSGRQASIIELLEIRDGELLDRVRLRWWQRGEIDKVRWRSLHDLINDRVQEAKQNTTRGLAGRPPERTSATVTPN